MSLNRVFKKLLISAAVVAAPAALSAQFTRPNVIANIPGDIAATLGPTVFINHGLVGVGRISASAMDSFGETLGSMSGMQITNWTSLGNGSYSGTLNFIPDRGYNSGNFYADYAARIEIANFVFTPHASQSPIGGTDDASKIAAQNQVQFTLPVGGVRFTYDDPTTGESSLTTGLDPGTSFTSLFGQIVPYVTSFSGEIQPSDPTIHTFNGINKLPLDSEALILKPDGSGYVGDEYGGYVYYFDSTKNIVGVIVPPPAQVPHHPLGVPFFSSTGAPNPDNGRRPNQGLEGVSLSPDGTRLFVLAQSATMQESDSSNDQSRRNTRLLVYDVSTTPTPLLPMLAYPVTLPTYKANGNGGAVNKTAQQSEVVALDNTRFLFLPRDGNGQGNASLNPSMYKSVQLADLGVGAPTDFHANAAANAEGGAIATVTNGTSNLNAGFTAVPTVEAVNVLNQAQLARFNVNLDTGSGQVTKLTLGEKWEGMALVPALDPANPDDYFLFLGNDNDFLTSQGHIRGPAGFVDYNGFDPASYPASRIPPPVAPSTNNENDTMVLVFRVTITATPTVTRGGFVLDRRTARFTQQVTITNTTANTLTGPIDFVVDNLSANATLVGPSGTTQNLAPLGSPFVTVVLPGDTLPPGASIKVVLQFNDPTVGQITYTPRLLVLTGPVTP